MSLNQRKASVNELVTALNNGDVNSAKVEVVVAPPFIYLEKVVSTIDKSKIAGVSSQNIWKEASGAFTGEVSAEMVKDVGATWTIIGHSERRDIIHESDELVGAKVKRAIQAGLGVIVCIGEHLEEHKAGQTEQVLVQQLKFIVANVSTASQWDSIVIAYEPVFCIGTGIAMSADEAQATQAIIRKYLSLNVSVEVANKVRIIYGGSVNGKNCFELSQKPDIDGFLVGGASLKAAEFLTIISSAGNKSNI